MGYSEDGSGHVAVVSESCQTNGTQQRHCPHCQENGQSNIPRSKTKRRLSTKHNRKPLRTTFKSDDDRWPILAPLCSREIAASLPKRLKRKMWRANDHL